MTEDALREQQRKRARLMAFVLVLVALGIYAGFVLMSVHRGLG